MNTGNCKHCGKALPLKAKSNKVYCNDICRVRSWEGLNPFPVRLQEPNGHHCYKCGVGLTGNRTKQCADCFRAAGPINQQRRAEHRNPESKICEQCGNSYKPIIGKTQRFCGDECCRAWWLANRSEHGKTYQFTCRNCGKEYQTKFSNRNSFCSRSCASKFGHLHRVRPVDVQPIVENSLTKCWQCSKPFASRWGAVLCSKECRIQRAREQTLSYSKVKRARQKERVCKECGKHFETLYGDKRKNYCSDSCGKRANAKVSKRTRRARRYGNGPVENIKPVEVYERDSWKCGICGEAVDRSLKYPDPSSASLDHIVALAQGGTHTWENVQLAHLWCNVHKGVLAIGQLSPLMREFYVLDRNLSTAKWKIEVALRGVDRWWEGASESLEL